MGIRNVNTLRKGLLIRIFSNFLQPVMSHAEFRGDFQKMAQFAQAVYTHYIRVAKIHSHKKAIMGAVVTRTTW